MAPTLESKTRESNAYQDDAINESGSSIFHELVHYRTVTVNPCSVKSNPPQDVNRTVMSAVPVVFCVYVSVSWLPLIEGVTSPELEFPVTENASGGSPMTFIMRICVGGEFSGTVTSAIGSNEDARQTV